MCRTHAPHCPFFLCVNNHFFYPKVPGKTFLAVMGRGRICSSLIFFRGFFTNNAAINELILLNININYIKKRPVRSSGPRHEKFCTSEARKPFRGTDTAGALAVFVGITTYVYFAKYSLMLAAALRPSPMARITVAAPRTMSPPAHTFACEVA